MAEVPSRVIASQNESHGVGHEYATGSPHLSHPTVRRTVEQRLRSLVSATTGPGGCHVLEVGAGHGTFTDTLLAAGARVTVSEVSEASAAHLAEKYRGDDRVQVLRDVSGTDSLQRPETWSAVVMISVLHHIPDYLDFVERVTRRVAPGGGFMSVQDPILYDRRSRAAHLAGTASYYAWRLGQGEWRRGLATTGRRLRGVYDDEEPSDLVEYHVVRRGVDEQALRSLLGSRFASTELWRYWSTQSALGQRWGAACGFETDFGLMALGRRPD